MVRPLAFLLFALVLAACGSEDPPKGPDLPTQLKRLHGAPPRLARLHTQANQLLDGGAEAFDKRLKELKGYPIVVNKWASWCSPCREEFPAFQRVGSRVGKQVAFLGVDANDNDGDAREFLKRYPVSYPTYSDPSLEVSELFKATIAWPSTAFYDSTGELAFLHQGPYREDQDLIEDIEQYAR